MTEKQEELLIVMLLLAAAKGKDSGSLHEDFIQDCLDSFEEEDLISFIKRHTNI